MADEFRRGPELSTDARDLQDWHKAPKLECKNRPGAEGGRRGLAWQAPRGQRAWDRRTGPGEDRVRLPLGSAGPA